MSGNTECARMQTMITIALIAIVPNDFRKGKIIRQYTRMLIATINPIAAPLCILLRHIR
jgi:hypothetical protein